MMAVRRRFLGSASRARRSNGAGFDLSAFLLIVLVLVLRTRGGLVATVAYLVVALYALWTPLSSIKALSLSWLITMINPGIAADSDAAEAMRWLVIAAVALRAFFASVRTGSVRIPMAVVGLSGFVFAAFAGSLAASYNREVSALKLLLFFAGAVGVLTTFHQAWDECLSMRRWLGTVNATVVILSLPLMFMDVGYWNNGHGFQGILNQPQAYGVFLAIALVHLCDEVLIRRERSVYLWSGLVGALVSILATEARTGVAAIVSGFILTCVLGALVNRQMLRPVFRGLLSTKSLVVVHLLTALVLFSMGDMRRAVEDFLFKRSQESSLSDAFYESRGYMAERSFENIVEHPLLGIGFGVSSEPSSQDVRRDPVFSIPMGAPVEKGLLPVAVLEETGAIGTLFFVLFLASLLVPVALQGSLGHLWIACTCLAVNVGESIFLSFGAMGLYQWLMLGYAVTRPRTLVTPRRKARAPWRPSGWITPRLIGSPATHVLAADH